MKNDEIEFFSFFCPFFFLHRHNLWKTCECSCCLLLHVTVILLDAYICIHKIKLVEILLPDAAAP